MQALIERQRLPNEDSPWDRLSFVPIAFGGLADAANDNFGLAIDLLDEPAPVLPERIASDDSLPGKAL